MKNIIITGGASKIGQEIIKYFAQQNINVIILNMNESLLEREFNSIITFKVDFNDADSFCGAIGRAYEFFGDIDLVINMADIHYNKNFLGTETWEFNDIMNTCLRSAYIVDREYIRLKQNDGNKQGAIVNVMFKDYKSAIHIAAASALKSMSNEIAKEFTNVNIKSIEVLEDNEKELDRILDVIHSLGVE